MKKLTLALIASVALIGAASAASKDHGKTIVTVPSVTQQDTVKAPSTSTPKAKVKDHVQNKVAPAKPARTPDTRKGNQSGTSAAGADHGSNASGGTSGHSATSGHEAK